MQTSKLRQLFVATRALALCWLLCSLPAAAGVLYFSQDFNPDGLFTLNLVTGQATKVGSGATGVNSATVGLAVGDSPTVLFGSQFGTIVRIQRDGSGFSPIPGSTSAEALEYANGVLYGAAGGNFFTINTVTGQRMLTLASPGVDIEGLAFGNGVIYGLAGGGLGHLYAYNIAMNFWSFVGDTGVDFDDPGLAYDTELNVLYAVGSQFHVLYRINPLTAFTSGVGSTGILSPGGGLAFAPNATEPEPIPEPGSALFLVSGLLLIAFRRKLFRN